MKLIAIRLWLKQYTIILINSKLPYHLILDKFEEEFKNNKENINIRTNCFQIAAKG